MNAIATYGRTVLSAGLALFSGRWVLNSLGHTDFGLYNVVGSLIVFIVFLNNIMSNGASRFYAHSIGQGNSTEVNKWFNAAISIHAILAIALVVIGYPIGIHFIQHVLNIPPPRMGACVIVFRISMFSAFVSMLTVPFAAMFTAKQRIFELSFIALLQSILFFALAWSMHWVSSDRLIYYSCGMVTIIVISRLIQLLRAMSAFPECKIHFTDFWNGSRIKSMFSFTGWTLIGGTGALLRDEGSAILLNTFFGPNVNAAYGISTQVSSQTNQLSTSLIGAFSPEIIASEGRGDRTRTISLSNQASKFGAFLVLLFMIPLIFEMDFVLKLWLKNPPEYAGTFCKLILISFFLDRLSTGHTIAISGHGKIAAFQASVGGCLLLSIPISWIFLHLGFPGYWVGVSFIVTMGMTTMGRVIWTQKILKMKIWEWIRQVVLPCLLVAMSASAVSIVCVRLLQPGIGRLFLTSATSGIVTLIAIWMTGMNPAERNKFYNLGKKLRVNTLGRLTT